MDVIYVDENDKEIGSGSIADSFENGIIVRISRVFLINDKGELLIQKRSDSSSLFPGRWDQTAGGYVDVGETYRQAAPRELNEEMGIVDVKLNEGVKFYAEETDRARTRRHFNTLFTGIYNGQVNIGKDEVSDYQWIELDDLEKQMAENPDNFTPGFIEAFNHYRNASA